MFFGQFFFSHLCFGRWNSTFLSFWSVSGKTRISFDIFQFYIHTYSLSQSGQYYWFLTSKAGWNLWLNFRPHCQFDKRRAASTEALCALMEIENRYKFKYPNITQQFASACIHTTFCIFIIAVIFIINDGRI